MMIDLAARVKFKVTKIHTITDAAKVLGVGRENLSEVLNGKREISIQLALKLERVYGINAERLLAAQLKNKIQAKRDDK